MVLAGGHELARRDPPHGKCLEGRPTVARLALAAGIGQAAAAPASWSGTRLGQDTLWWKAPRTKPVSHHQDTSFLDVLDPQATVTCWVRLDDTHCDAGTLEYIPGSHLWPLTPIPEGFHAPEDFRAQMRAAAAAGITPPDPALIEVPAESRVFHAGEIWHGSGPNLTDDRMRRAIRVHLVPEQPRFSDRPGGYIYFYRRYQSTGDPTMDESYFPILWSGSGHRTGWIEDYCETGRRMPPRAA